MNRSFHIFSIISLIFGRAFKTKAVESQARAAAGQSCSWTFLLDVYRLSFHPFAAANVNIPVPYFLQNSLDSAAQNCSTKFGRPLQNSLDSAVVQNCSTKFGRPLQNSLDSAVVQNCSTKFGRPLQNGLDSAEYKILAQNSEDLSRTV